MKNYNIDIIEQIEDNKTVYRIFVGEVSIGCAETYQKASEIRDFCWMAITIAEKNSSKPTRNQWIIFACTVINIILITLNFILLTRK